MFDQKTFEYNLLLLDLITPSLAVKLNALLDEQALLSYSFSRTNGEDNLSVSHEGQTYYLHDPEGPSQEAKEWISRLVLDQCDVLYIYGLGLGYFYDALLPWLKQNPTRYVVFLEDDLMAFRSFLGTSRATPLLQDSQVDIRDFSQVQYDRSIARLAAQDNILRSFSLTALPSYQQHKFASYSIIRDLIEFESAEQNIRFQELAQFGVSFFNNFYRNLLQLPSAYSAHRLANQFKDIPAIICGAGPSLVKQLPLLKELDQKAIIFGPGSALNSLSYHGFSPHFGVNIDPTPETFHRQIMNRAFETPVFYRNRIYYEALHAIHGPRLFISGAVFYRLANWFESQLGIPSLSLEGGYNVVHAALEIAHLLGCNPIIFVGLDLSFQEGTHYASGVERHPLFPQKTDQKIHLGPPIEVKDIKGKQVWTYWPWIAEAQWTELYSKLHPELKLINASEEGIGLFSIPNISLEEASQTYLKQSYNLSHLIHTAIQGAGHVSASREKIELCIKDFYQSLKRCEACCLQILQNIFSNENQLKEAEDALKREAGFDYLLEQFDEFFLLFVQKDLRNLKRLADEQRTVREKGLKEERYRFLLQTARVNLKIIENTLQEAASAQPTHSHERPHSLPDSHKENCYYASGTLFSSQGQDFKHYYYDNGALKTELYYDEQGRLNGVAKLYYPNGAIKRELSFKNGQRDGIERSWYENGQLFTEVDYQNNSAKHARCWFPDGTLAKDLSL